MPRSKLHPVVSATRDIPLAATLVMGTGLGLLTLLLVSGCAEKSAVQAEDREVPLTTGDANNVWPYFSPDDKQVLFTSIEGPKGLQGTEIKMISANGGDVRVLADTPHQMGRGWAPGKKVLLVWNGMHSEVRWMDLDGKIQDAVKVPDMTYLQDVSPDGELLLGQFVGDNYDLGVMTEKGSDLTIIEPTPEWEVHGIYGPGAGEITIVRQEGYRSPSSQIVIRSRDGSENTLPLGEAKLRSPAWSPDRRYLAYVSDQTGNMDLWVYEAESRRTIQVTSTPEDESTPRWSHDGTWLVFSRSKHTSNLFLGDPETFERQALTKSPGEDTNPWVSPDGKWVAFYRKDPKEKEGRLCVASLPDGEVKELPLSVTLTMEQWPITWSPDGTEVAVPADDGFGNVDIYRVSLADGRARRVTIASGVDTNPSWSPDGETIAYIRLVEGGIEVWTVPATGGLAQQISSTPGMNVLPRWSPDSRYLAWASEKQREAEDEEEEVELWVAPVEDPADAWQVEARLPDGRGCYPLFWSRDGKKLFVQRFLDEGIMFFSVSLKGSEAYLAATVGQGNQDDFLVFTDKGEIFKDQWYPGGMCVFADGEEISNIYKIRVPEIVEAWLQADGGLN